MSNVGEVEFDMLISNRSSTNPRKQTTSLNLNPYLTKTAHEFINDLLNEKYIRLFQYFFPVKLFHSRKLVTCDSSKQATDPVEVSPLKLQENKDENLVLLSNSYDTCQL